MSLVGNNLRELNTGAQRQASRYPSASKSVLYSKFQRIHGEIGRTISDVQKRDGQTNSQKTQHFWLPGGG